MERPGLFWFTFLGGTVFASLSGIAFYAARHHVTGGNLRWGDHLGLFLVICFGVYLVMMALHGINNLPPPEPRAKRRRGPVDGIVSLAEVRQRRGMGSYDGEDGPHAA